MQIGFKDKLTIVLPLKGREQFTFRWLKFVNERNFPFTVMLADGGSGNTIRNHIENENFEGLALKYFKHSEDVNFQAFYRKMKDAYAV